MSLYPSSCCLLLCVIARFPRILSFIEASYFDWKNVENSAFSMSYPLRFYLCIVTTRLMIVASFLLFTMFRI